MTETKTGNYGWSQEMSTALFDKLKADLKHSMLNKDVQARSAIRQIMAEFPRLTVPITLESGKKTTRPKKSEEIRTYCPGGQKRRIFRLSQHP
jgi:hypothetical protein